MPGSSNVNASTEIRTGIRRTRIKICGITLPEHGVCAAENGADAIGLVFYPPSPRAVDARMAATICAELPPFTSRVALFVNASVDEVRRVLDVCPIDTLQFHGDEESQYCASFGVPYVKSIGVKPGVDVVATVNRYPDAAGVLLDQHDRVNWGGTGQAFDWALVPGERLKPTILAGGLTPDNVAEAIRTVRPEAVDVSGGVEASKGVKDAEKIKAFIRGVESVSTEQ